MSTALALVLPVFADAAEEGKKVLIGMLLVGLTFIAVIALGETSKYLKHRRKARGRASY
ncbi:MAG: hypothetical protein ICV59_00015 [Thermoleophilia bacterium]|nr:hypothetical protein [Thermoleophilia bacterium]